MNSAQRAKLDEPGAITFVAVKLADGKVWTMPFPCRHNHVLWAIYQCRGERVATEERDVQGFALDDGRFLDRKEAAAYALERKQIAALRWPPDLYSEDLW